MRQSGHSKRFYSTYSLHGFARTRCIVVRKHMERIWCSVREQCKVSGENIFESNNRNSDDVQKKTAAGWAEDLRRKHYRCPEKLCADEDEEQIVRKKDDQETVKERRARSSMGCLLGICVFSRNASGARTCAPSGLL